MTNLRDGTSTEEIIDMFVEKTQEEPTIAIIYEVDQIADDEVLYDLSRFQSGAMIFIANDQKIFSHFEDRLRSRFSGMRRIHSRRCEKDELVDILRPSRKHGLSDSSVSKNQLEDIAVRLEERPEWLLSF